MAEGTDDLAKVQEYIKGEVERYAAEITARQPQVQQQQQDTQQQQLRELISPFVDPHVNEAKLQAANSLDYVKFYTNNPDAAEYQDYVEKTFEQLKSAGRPISRADILNHAIGQEYRTDRDKFTEKLSAKRQAQLERAEGATDVGGFSTSRAKNDSTFGVGNFDKLTSDEQASALDGVVF